MNRLTYQCLTCILVAAVPARADIYQWEYINPADPSQGKQQSTTLVPEGAGVGAVPGAYLAYRNLSNAYFIGANLVGANVAGANLTNADLSHADLTKGILYSATLTGVDFTDAEVRGAFFYVGDGSLTRAQLYSTASYQAHDLTGIGLSGELSDGNFAGQKLVNANFSYATLTSPDFGQADLTSAFFFYPATLTGANFSGAVVRGAYFWGTMGLTAAQLYSTASYQAHDLAGISFGNSDLSNRNLAGQNLTNASFGFPDIFSGLPTRFYYATLNGADLTGADTRGAASLESVDLSDATTTNLIWPDGYVDGLDLDAGGVLVVHDYESTFAPIPITVDQHMAMGPGGTLRMVFEADAWDSTILFAPSISVALGGTLELTFAADVNPATQVGRTFDLFDWTGVNPTGAFTVSSLHRWDLSNVYTTGKVTLVSVPESHAMVLYGCAIGALNVIAGGRHRFT